MATTPTFASTNIRTNTFLNLGAVFSSYIGNWEDQPTSELPNLVTAGSNGTRITEVNAKVIGNVGNMTIKFYLFDGSTYYLFDEHFLNGSVTAAGSVDFNITYDYLYLASGWSFRMGINGFSNEPARIVVTSLDL